MRAFVNERGVELAEGATVRDAIHAFDPNLAARVASEARARVTDARGIDVSLDGTVRAGDIFRVMISARDAGRDDDA